MESGPSKIIAWLIPPACREEVFGDLCEEGGGIGKSLYTILFVVLSRVRRVTDPLVAFMNAVALYTAFVLMALWTHFDPVFDPWGLLMIAIGPLAMIVALMLADAYSDPQKKSPYKPLMGMALAAIAAMAVGMPFFPQTYLMLATGWSLLLMLPIRLTFPPELPQAAKIAPHWQKLEMISMSAFARRVTACVLFALLILIIIAAVGSSRG